MILPMPASKYKILKLVYEKPGIKISDMLKITKTSQRTGYRYVKELLKSNVISESLQGKKPTLRLFKPRFSESGKICFTLLEIQKKINFFALHKNLIGPLTQFETETKNLVDCILIFGSFSTGAETQESDIDILVLGKNVKPQIEKISERCFVTIKNRNSIRILSTKEFSKLALQGDNMIMQVLKHHIIVVNAARWIDIIAKILPALSRT